MRWRGHPVHVMLIHFPIALWPAHFLLHLCSGRLPGGVATIGGFWLLAAGTVLGWLAALCGAMDLFVLARDGPSRRFKDALVHAVINGSVLAGFTLLTVLELNRYPAIQDRRPCQIGELVLLAALVVGNYFGGSVVWRDVPADPKRRV